MLYAYNCLSCPNLSTDLDNGDNRILIQTFICRPGPKFQDDFMTILWQLSNSQNTYDNLGTYLTTTSYDHLVDVQ